MISLIMATTKKVLWQSQNVSETNVAKFIEYVNKVESLDITTYDELHDWSSGKKSFQDFWRLAYGWLQISPYKPRSIESVMRLEVSFYKNCGL